MQQQPGKLMKVDGYILNHRREGLIGIEVVVSIVLMTLLAGVVATAILDYHKTQDRFVWRQSALWAAEAQLQRYRAGAEIDSLPPDGVLPEQISLETLVEAGQDQWKGFDRVVVTAIADLPNGTTLREQVSGYLPKEVSP